MTSPKAIELNPTNDEAYNGRGSAYADRKQYEKAVEDFTRLMELNPDDILPFL